MARDLGGAALCLLGIVIFLALLVVLLIPGTFAVFGAAVLVIALLVSLWVFVLAYGQRGR